MSLASLLVFVTYRNPTPALVWTAHPEPGWGKQAPPRLGPAPPCRRGGPAGRVVCGDGPRLASLGSSCGAVSLYRTFFRNSFQ